MDVAKDCVTTYLLQSKKSHCVNDHICGSYASVVEVDNPSYIKPGHVQGLDVTKEVSQI